MDSTSLYCNFKVKSGKNNGKLCGRRLANGSCRYHGFNLTTLPNLSEPMEEGMSMIPNDVMNLILPLLPIQTLLFSSLVSRLWNKLCSPLLGKSSKPNNYQLFHSCSLNRGCYVGKRIKPHVERIWLDEYLTMNIQVVILALKYFIVYQELYTLQLIVKGKVDKTTAILLQVESPNTKLKKVIDTL